MNDLHVFPTPDAWQKAVADFIVELAGKSVRERGRFVIALSGGRTPENLYVRLSQPPYRELMPWKHSFIFWGDERCVPPDDNRNNAFRAKTVLLEKTDVPDNQVFPVPVELEPAKAAALYEQTLRGFFDAKPPQFDLMLLGLGENGHTASLFPHSEVLREKSAWVRDVWVEEQNMYRVTMTLPIINQSGQVLFLVTGTEKAEILRTVLTGPFQPDSYPAQLVRPENGRLAWFVDREAAALLNFEKK